MADVRGVLGKDIARTRQILRKLLVGRLECRAFDESGRTGYRFALRGSYAELLPEAMRPTGRTFSCSTRCACSPLLAREVTHPMEVFLMWFQLCYPDLVMYQPAEAYLHPVRESTSDAATFKLLARELLRQGSATPP